ncbi:MAG: antibiotic biosynthesis monooxygenase [Actinobacteria bacterium]|nr:antibiotic biosynthesis monooxygenase [Actinomycetota bacterium]
MVNATLHPTGGKEGEPGNLAFAVHRSTDNPDEFWLYETWESQEAVDAHESGPAFVQYKDRLRPLVDGDTVLFGNVTPIAVLGYEA